MNTDCKSHEQSDSKMERVDKEFTDALIERHKQYIEETGDEALDAKFKEALKRSLLETEFTPRGTRKNLNYVRLSLLLSLCGFPAAEIYRAMSIPVYLPDERCENIVAALESFPPATRKKLKEIAYGMSPSWWKERQITLLPPSDRAREIIRRRISTADRKELSVPSLQKAWSMAGMTTSLETKELPEAARLLGVSLHWLMQMEENAPCYSRVKDVDSILDSYGMMGEAAREYFCALIQEAKKGVEEYDF